ARTRCGTASRPTWSPVGPICGRCKRCSATPASVRRKSTRTSIQPGSRRSTGSFTRAGDLRTEFVPFDCRQSFRQLLFFVVESDAALPFFDGPQEVVAFGLRGPNGFPLLEPDFILPFTL